MLYFISQLINDEKYELIFKNTIYLPWRDELTSAAAIVKNNMRSDSSTTDDYIENLIFSGTTIITLLLEWR